MMFHLGFDLRQSAQFLDRRDRIFTRPEAFGPRNVQHRLNSLGQPLCRFVLFRPYRREAHHHLRLINAINRHPPDLGESIIAQGVDPLLAVLGVLPCGHPVNMDLLRNLFKGWHLLACIKSGVQPLLGHAAIFERPFPRLVQGHYVSPTQTKVGTQWRTFFVLLAFDHDAHNPAPRARWINHQIKTIAVAVPPRTKVLDQLLSQLPR